MKINLEIHCDELHVSLLFHETQIYLTYISAHIYQAFNPILTNPKINVTLVTSDIHLSRT